MKFKNLLLILSSFTCLFLIGCGRYAKREGKWAYIHWNEGSGWQIYYIPEADTDSFRKLKNPSFAADKNYVYYQGRPIKNADPTTFRPFHKSYWRDAQRVFYFNLEIPNADPETFQILEKKAVAKDKNDVYSGTTPLKVEDISTFQLLQGPWAKDSKAYYSISPVANPKKLNCDYQSFVILNDEYAKDKNSVFWQGLLIKNAHSPSFEILEHGAKDKHRRYIGPNAKDW